MAFGPIMRLAVGELDIELGPIAKSDMKAYVSPGMQLASITKYLERRSAPVLEDEEEWFDHIRQQKDALTWGIYLLKGDDRRLIGGTSLHNITHKHIVQSGSGSMIFAKEYWGKGIASHIHKARTWYAFYHLGHAKISSSVIQGNVASRKALEKAGYRHIYTERNTHFVEGQLKHLDHLECLNPDPAMWRRWWGNDRPSKAAVEARKRAEATLAWAEENVELP